MEHELEEITLKQFLWIFIFLSRLTSGQSLDTLMINNIKYPLQKAKIFYKKSWGLDITLPSEYQPATKSYTVNYKCNDVWDYETGPDNNGNHVTVALVPPDSCIRGLPGHFVLDNFSAELNLTYVIGSSIVPYIKSGNKKYYFNSAKLIQIQNDTLAECSFDWPMEPVNVDFEFMGRYGKPSNLYFLKNLTYRKGNATFVLHHTFLIRRTIK